ncbi:cell wall hydrolase [Christensenellaceae bacterium OttesenSCG-928-L17]|nr:cell wall hydrolase [Christensenellaceae bacterium OttesenSCG-928-L17]
MTVRTVLWVALIAVLLLCGCAKEAKPGGEAQPNMEDANSFNEEESTALELSELLTPTPVPLVPVGQSAPNPTPSASMPAQPTATPTPKAAGTPEVAATPKPASTPSFQLTSVKNEKGYVLGRNVNMRSGPGTDYSLVKKVSNPATLLITGKTDLWYRVVVGETEGFLLKEFVGLGSIPTPTPTPKATTKPTSTPKPSSTPTTSEETPEATSAPTPSPSEEIKQGSKGNYADADIYLAAKLIYAEGKSQTRESFLAMANVLYNRCNSSKFGGTVEREVYRSGQFSVVKYDSFESLVPSAAALAAVEDVFNGGKRTLPDGVLYFRSASKGEYWSSSRKFYKKIGGNNYYY